MDKQGLEKIDFSKIHRDLYTATPKPKEVTAARATFLSVEGMGEPGGAAFQAAIQQLYNLAYTLKFMLKQEGKLDFAVGRLECLWNIENIDETPRSEWRWQLILRIPDAVTAGDLKKARAEVLRKSRLDTSGVQRWTWKEGRCVQRMHVGPYGEAAESFRQLDAFAAEKGLVASCPAHEIYVSDPRRVPPSRLKTIVRLPVSPRTA